MSESKTDWEQVKASLAHAERDPLADPIAGASDEQLTDLESRLGIALPEALVAWLRICNGDTLGQGGVLGARPDRQDLDIAQCRALFAHEWRDRMWLPVASDGCGNYYVLDEAGAVGFVDTMADPASVERTIAESLGDFLTWFVTTR